MRKIRQTSFMQTGAAELLAYGRIKRILPLFTEDIVRELHDFLKGYEETTSKDITYRVCVRFFDPVREGSNFKLTENSMEVLRTGVPGYTTVANEEARYFLPYKFNCNLFPSYYS